MPNELPPDSPIRRYIRDNRAVYAPDAIRRQLIDAGNPPAVVDQALADEFPSEPTVSVLGRAMAIALLMFVGAALVVGIVFGTGGGRYVPDIVGTTMFALVYFLPGFLISLIVIAVMRSRPVPRSRALSATVVALAIPFVIALAMTGFCLTAFQQA